jgi:predicted Zn-dependent protease
MADAEKEYLSALKLRPDTSNLHLELGQVYAMTSRWPQAEEQFRAETTLQPGNAEAAYRLGNTLLQQGKAHEACVELQQSNQLQPQMPETLYALGKASALDHDEAAAEKAWSQQLEVEKDGPLAAQAHFGLAGLYRRQGKSAKAEEQMREFQKLQGASDQNQEHQ